MRCFIAVDIDDAVRDGLARLQNELIKKASAGRGEVKWVEPQLVHLTLKFLGEVDDKAVVEVCRIVAEICERYEGFSMEVAKAGCFGSPARVVWVGINENEVLNRLQEEIESVFEQLGWPREGKKFSPHLTLCRVNNIKAGRKLADLVKDYGDKKIGSVEVDSVAVYRSDLTPKGPVYTVLSRSKLK